VIIILKVYTIKIMSQLSTDKYLSVLDDLLSKGQAVQVSVRGMSMFPLLMKGDVVLVKPVTYVELRKGDIVVFERNGIWVAHRLIRKYDGNILTNGDGNQLKDAPLSFSSVKGIVVKVVKSRWWLANLATKWPGRALAYTSLFTGPAFWILGRVASKLYLLFKKEN
jgi:signal peptidase I